MSLTDGQKNLIKWFVEKTRSKELVEEFYVAWSLDKGTLNKRDYTGATEEIPVITKMALDALKEEGLLRCDRNFRRSRETNRKCLLTPDAFMAVDSDFAVKPVESSSSINLENITDSQIVVQQDSPGATQTATFTLSYRNKEDLTGFVNELEILIEQLQELQIDIKNDLGKLRLQMNTIRLHLESDYSESAVVEESLKSIKSVLEGIIGSAIVAAALNPEMYRLVNHLLEQVSLYLP